MRGITDSPVWRHWSWAFVPFIGHRPGKGVDKLPGTSEPDSCSCRGEDHWHRVCRWEELAAAPPAVPGQRCIDLVKGSVVEQRAMECRLVFLRNIGIASVFPISGEARSGCSLGT